MRVDIISAVPQLITPVIEGKHPQACSGKRARVEIAVHNLHDDGIGTTNQIDDIPLAEGGHDSAL